MKLLQTMTLAALLTASSTSSLLAASHDDWADHRGSVSRHVSPHHHHQDREASANSNHQHSLLVDSIDYVSQYRVVKGTAWLAASISYRILPSCVYNALENSYNRIRGWLYGSPATHHHSCDIDVKPCEPIRPHHGCDVSPKPQAPTRPHHDCNADPKPHHGCGDNSGWTVVNHKRHHGKGHHAHHADTSVTCDDDSFEPFSFKQARAEKIARDAKKKDYSVEKDQPIITWRGPRLKIADYMEDDSGVLKTHQAGFQRLLKTDRK